MKYGKKEKIEIKNKIEKMEIIQIILIGIATILFVVTSTKLIESLIII